MKSVWKSSILGMMAGGLAACGGGSDGAPASASSQKGEQAGVATPAPTPAPASTPTSSLATTEERLVLPDNTLYAPGDYFAYASPWCATYDPSLAVGSNIVDTISILRSTFPNDVVISAKVPDNYPTVSRCGVYGYNAITFGHYLTVNSAAKMQPMQVKDIRTLSMQFDMSLSGDGEFNILAESFLTGAAKDFGTKLEIGFYTHSTPRSASFARSGTPIGTYVDNAGRSWTVTKVDDFVMFLHGSGDLLTGMLDIKGAYTFLMNRGVLTGNEWFNGVSLGMEPMRGNGVAAIHTWSVTYG
ncbi:hypothetical protein KFK14_06575 [Sphingobium phenoxybenzoativorans]|uniref:Uncharacterized protein n=1 Tax=Sphingobium phenoxybenzoativorans TaxID=1592790 RepID=A0A975KAK3_9SPHN|nr:hypothetical protein [Sphingobium phenoxybenzoativorans]QUT07083.1 hypothetical protein KFK14_06575 [Sphingobium phenoxybenzoativorans]